MQKFYLSVSFRFLFIFRFFFRLVQFSVGEIGYRFMARGFYRISFFGIIGDFTGVFRVGCRSLDGEQRQVEVGQCSLSLFFYGRCFFLRIGFDFEFIRVGFGYFFYRFSLQNGGGKFLGFEVFGCFNKYYRFLFYGWFFIGQWGQREDNVGLWWLGVQK